MDPCDLGAESMHPARVIRSPDENLLDVSYTATLVVGVMPDPDVCKVGLRSQHLFANLLHCRCKGGTEEHRLSRISSLWREVAAIHNLFDNLVKPLLLQYLISLVNHNSLHKAETQSGLIYHVKHAPWSAANNVSLLLHEPVALHCEWLAAIDAHCPELQCLEHSLQLLVSLHGQFSCGRQHHCHRHALRVCAWEERSHSSNLAQGQDALHYRDDECEGLSTPSLRARHNIVVQALVQDARYDVSLDLSWSLQAFLLEDAHEIGSENTSLDALFPGSDRTSPMRLLCALNIHRQVRALRELCLFTTFLFEAILIDAIFLR
mmetsp:Transcript_73083/g.174128  ORF Transcript_73083/g.174128 Transcript_73083/m.174128 type:complete len:320 (-) Transcript_73083:794-1753(-)